MPYTLSMAAKAHITSDFATPSEVASHLGIPPSRTAELRQRLLDLHVAKSDGTVMIFRAKNVAHSSTRRGGTSRHAKKK